MIATDKSGDIPQFEDKFIFKPWITPSSLKPTSYSEKNSCLLPVKIMSSSLSNLNLIGLLVFFANKAQIQAVMKFVSFPPNPPPILLTSTFIELLFWLNIFAINCCVSDGCCVEL